MRHTSFEIRHLIAAPFTLIFLVYFVALFWAKKRIPTPWVYPLYVFSTPFLVMDFIYQVIVGSFLFLDRPRHWLFTGRLSDMKKQGDDRVERFELVLNESGPGHV